MSNLLQDMGVAWRAAVGKPAGALLIVLTLALGIGANSAMFSMAWHVLGAPLPYADGAKLVRLQQDDRATGRRDMPWSAPTLADFRAGATAFTDVVGYFQSEYPLYGNGAPHLALVGVVDWRFFDVLGIAPALGRGFIAADDQPGAAPVVLLSNEFWRREFGGRADVIGRTLEMNAISYTVAGVLRDMPPWPRGNEVWIPMGADAVMTHESGALRFANGLLGTVIARLAPEAGMRDAARDADRLANQFSSAYPDIYGQGFEIGVRSLREELAGDAGPSFVLLLALAFLVVLIAGANVANLNLARLAGRRQELSVREAVGADPGRIRRQLLAESLLTAMAGALLGLALAALVLGLLRDFAARYTPLAGGIRLDAPVLLFTLAIASLTGLFSGMAATHGRPDLGSVLKEGGDRATASAGARRRGRILLVTQYAVAFVLLVTSALTADSLIRLNGQDPGFEVDGILTGSTLLDLTPGLAENPWEGRDLVLSLLRDIEAMPGVEGVAAAGFPLLQDLFYGGAPVLVEGRGEPEGSAPFVIVSESYFDVMGIPLLQGRLLRESDDEHAENALVVNEAFAERYFPGGDAVGQRVSFTNGFLWDTIVGVVADARSRGLDRLEGPLAYTNYRAGPTQVLNLYIRAPEDMPALAGAVTRRFQSLAPRVPAPTFRPLGEARDRWLAPVRLRTWVIGSFASLALTVTLAGVVGLVSCDVGRRRREIGIRAALGAAPDRVVRTFLAEGLRLLAAGLLLGLALMLAVAPLLQALLYGMDAVDVPIYFLVAMMLTGAVLTAILLPSLAAARMEPCHALRGEGGF